MNYFLYNPVTQYDNTGDLLINKTLISLLRIHGQIIIDDRDKPAAFISQLITPQDQKLSALTEETLFSFLERRLIQVKQSAGDVYYLVFVPGDFSKEGLKRALSGLKLYFRLRKLHALGCRILRLGASLSTFDLPNYMMESLYSTTYSAYGLRDYKSVTKALRYRFSRVCYFPDLAWAYCPYAIKGGHHVAGKHIVISFRANPSGIIHNSDFFSHIKHQVFAMLSHRDFCDYKIVVSYQVRYDREACQELVDLFSDTFDVEFIDKPLSLAEASDLYKHADMVISNRLHVVLLGSICGTLSLPFISPPDNMKITNIYADNAMDDLIFDYRDDVSILQDQLINLVQRTDVVKRFVKIKQQHNTRIIENTIKKIVERP